MHRQSYSYEVMRHDMNHDVSIFYTSPVVSLVNYHNPKEIAIMLFLDISFYLSGVGGELTRSGNMPQI